MSRIAVKKVKINNNKLITIEELFLCYNYPPYYAHFSILTTETNGLIKLTPSLSIKVHKVFAPRSYFNLFPTLACTRI